MFWNSIILLKRKCLLCADRLPTQKLERAKDVVPLLLGFCFHTTCFPGAELLLEYNTGNKLFTSYDTNQQQRNFPFCLQILSWPTLLLCPSFLSKEHSKIRTNNVLIILTGNLMTMLFLITLHYDDIISPCVNNTTVASGSSTWSWYDLEKKSKPKGENFTVCPL